MHCFHVESWVTKKILSVVRFSRLFNTSRSRDELQTIFNFIVSVDKVNMTKEIINLDGVLMEWCLISCA